MAYMQEVNNKYIVAKGISRQARDGTRSGRRSRQIIYKAHDSIMEASETWKIAYGDFVTTLMAFFLLMWALNKGPASKIHELAEAFKPTISSSKKYLLGNEVSIQNEGANNEKGMLPKDRTLDILEASMSSVLNRHINTNNSVNVQISRNNLGITINIFDGNEKYIFAPGSAEITPSMQSILRKVAVLIKHTPNFISIGGHTDKELEGGLPMQYSDWELSADRANATRRFLTTVGIAPEKFVRIIAYADTDPLISGNPYDPRNRRISITLLQNAVVPAYKVAVLSIAGGAR